MENTLPTPSAILMAANATLRNVQSKFFRDGVEMEKGAIITPKRIKKNLDLYEKWCEFFINYPDIFLDIIKRQDSHFDLFFYQRLFLRLTMRLGRLFLIACRAFSKSFISILGLNLMCIFRPGIKLFICAKLRPIIVK